VAEFVDGGESEKAQQSDAAQQKAGTQAVVHTDDESLPSKEGR
jgi:hypothetical protein